MATMAVCGAGHTNTAWATAIVCHPKPIRKKGSQTGPTYARSTDCNTASMLWHALDACNPHDGRNVHGGLWARRRWKAAPVKRMEKVDVRPLASTASGADVLVLLPVPKLMPDTTP